MKQRKHGSVLVALLCVVWAFPAVYGGDRPNVLFIAIDDLNGSLSAFDEHPRAKTPQIDALAKRGVLFSNAHCAAPACNPSRTAVMTGMAPTSSGVYFNYQDWRASSRLKDIVTLPEHFRKSGYRVLGGGKLYHASSLNEVAHTGLLDPEPWHEFYPSKSRQLVAEALPLRVPLHGNPKFYKGFMDWAALEIADSEMGDAKVVSWAEEQLSRSHEDPLFLAVGIYRPHIPFYTPASYFNLYPGGESLLPKVEGNDLDDIPVAGKEMARRHWQEWIESEGQWEKFVRGYLASVSFADAMVGRLITALDAGPLRENTIVVLWSDHGYHLGHKEHWEKFALWRQASRVPLIFAGPGLESGLVHDEPVSLLDLYPTLAELTDTDEREQWDGKSLVPFFHSDEATSERAIVITQGPGNHAVQSREGRYIRYADGSEEFYDHRQDREEFTNLIGSSEWKEAIEEHRKWLPQHEAPLDPVERWRER